MAGIVSRIAHVFRAGAGQAAGGAPDPGEAFDYAYSHQLEQLSRLMYGLAEVATGRRRLELRIGQLANSAHRLEEQARQALAEGKEELAREALALRAGVRVQAARLEERLAVLRAQEDGFTAALKHAQATAEACGARMVALAAEYTRAEAQVGIGAAVAGLGQEVDGLGAVLPRLQDEAATSRADVDVLDTLVAFGALDDATVNAGAEPETKTNVERPGTP
ncbi:PspA/IM30 family protein [Kitasatospora sp. NPDC101155]|uniref:PspA/IM30 family protein n=1 Tax=Kitasatospora sp. NPDC101155 TaxID=3364097 RepID=UPI00382AAB8B